MDLCSVLEPWRPTRTDKPAILDDAIRVLSQLKDEAQELKETNEKLLEEIKSLKVDFISVLRIQYIIMLIPALLPFCFLFAYIFSYFSAFTPFYSFFFISFRNRHLAITCFFDMMLYLSSYTRMN